MAHAILSPSLQPTIMPPYWSMMTITTKSSNVDRCCAMTQSNCNSLEQAHKLWKLLTCSKHLLAPQSQGQEANLRKKMLHHVIHMGLKWLFFPSSLPLLWYETPNWTRYYVLIWYWLGCGYLLLFEQPTLNGHGFVCTISTSSIVTLDLNQLPNFNNVWMHFWTLEHERLSSWVGQKHYQPCALKYIVYAKIQWS